MSNIKITIDEIEKELRICDTQKEWEAAEYFFNKQWYREVEPVKQDYEILSFRIGIHVWLKNLIGNYEVGGHAPIFNATSMLEFVKGNSATIESVKRLSDGEVFTVGVKEEECKVIEKIEIFEGSVRLMRSANTWIMLKYAEKVKQPTILLTTEDGVKITDGEQKIFVVLEGFEPYWHYAKSIVFTKKSKCFSTSASRDEYILMNKPITVSFKEFIEWEPFKAMSYLFKDELLNRFKQLQTTSNNFKQK